MADKGKFIRVKIGFKVFSYLVSLQNARNIRIFFDNLWLFFNHSSKKCRSKTCLNYSLTFTKAAHLDNHLHKQRRVTCDHCNRTFCSNDEFQKHVRSTIRNTDDTIADLDQRLYPETGYEDKEKYHETVDQKINKILDS